MLFGQYDLTSTKLSSSDDEDFESQPDHQHGVAVEESKPELKEPSMYQVVLLNDDYTPMEFVVDVLVHLFSKNRVQATKIMLQVHHEGKGVCGSYTWEVAETKVMQVNEYAKENAHPLIATMEKTSS
jgi:ATP-dependent Clp protease adaptor protein ClpS